MVLITKVGGGYRCIGIVEVIRKFCASIVNKRLRNEITINDALYGFRQGRGTGTVTMEDNLSQKLAGIVHEPLFHVFIDVSKSYDSLDRGICMEILRSFGIGPNLQRLLRQ